MNALALFSRLRANSEVFCTTFSNNCLNLNLDETIGHVLTEDIRRKSMGLTINYSAEAHNSTESIDRFNCSRKQDETTSRNSRRPRHLKDRQWSKSRNSRSSVFCTHCKKSSHDVSESWSIKRKENVRRLKRNTRRSNSNHSPIGNQINFANSRSGEILSLEDSIIGEVLYSAQDAQTWLLDSGATFHVIPNIKWFSNYLTEMSGTIRLGNGQECTIVGIREVAIRLLNGNTTTLHQVQYVPTLKRSLVSINMLAENGYRTTLSESSWMISRGNLKIGNGYK